LLTIAAVVWLAINGQVEGPTLLVLTPGNELILADLPSVAALIVAVSLTFRREPRKGRRVRIRGR
jgi:hypothetical protein